jgi:stage III sporulation protein SpoIIIAA
MERRITDNLDELKRVLPRFISDALDQLENHDGLIEIVMDLGRIPTARYIEGEIELADAEITREDIDSVVFNIGNFDADNRAGMERTLHRISGIRNRKQDIVGLTCRVGRAVYGTIDIVQDLIDSGQSVLLLGPPGVGKTTLLRESARVLAESKRVVIVDTSNEIGGDGDVPHPAVGRARRMQVSRPEQQHEVMIEAVENHNPEVIVIDEIGRELEALAARTIAERGVQLIGTAHGNALDNLLLNPTLCDLVGGIESVTLSDEEARRRGTQKSVLERRAPPTFDVLVEIQTRHRVVVHEDVAAAVDAALRGKPLQAELRARHADGDITREMIVPELRIMNAQQQTRNEPQRVNPPRKVGGNGNGAHANGNGTNGANSRNGRTTGNGKTGALVEPPLTQTRGNGGVYNMPPKLEPTTVYAFGVARNRLFQAAKRLHVPLTITDDVAQADAILTLKNFYRRRPKLIVDAERRGTQIFVLRANTASQMENFVVDLFQLEQTASPDWDEEEFEDEE